MRCLLSELGSREEPPGEGAVLWVAVTVMPTHRLSPQEAEVQDIFPSSVCLSVCAELCSASESPLEKHCRRQDNTWLF